MTESASERISVELSLPEARLILAALRQFEPFWPSDMEDMDRIELLSGIHQGIDHIRSTLGTAQPPPTT